MEYPPEKIYIRPNRLRRKEVVGHEGNPVGDVRGNTFLRIADHFFKVLNNELQRWEFPGEGLADKALGASNLDGQSQIGVTMGVCWQMNSHRQRCRHCVPPMGRNL